MVMTESRTGRAIPLALISTATWSLKQYKELTYPALPWAGGYSVLLYSNFICGSTWFDCFCLQRRTAASSATPTRTSSSTSSFSPPRPEGLTVSSWHSSSSKPAWSSRPACTPRQWTTWWSPGLTTTTHGSALRYPLFVVSFLCCRAKYPSTTYELVVLVDSGCGRLSPGWSPVVLRDPQLLTFWSAQRQRYERSHSRRN